MKGTRAYLKNCFLRQIYLPLFLSNFLIFGGTASAEQEKGLSILEAVNAAVKLNPAIRLAEQEAILNQGRLQETAGAFDFISDLGLAYGRDYTILNSIQAEQGGMDDLKTEVSGLNASLTKLLRSGQTAALEANTSRTEDVLSNATVPSTSEVKFSFIQPLLKGRGNDSAGAEENRASKELEASRYEQKRALIKNISDVAQSYWAYLAARHSLEVLKESEGRARKRHEDTKILIAEGELPETEIQQAAADLSARMARVSLAEADLYSAKHSLGLLMGVGSEEIENLPLPAEEFPKGPAGQGYSLQKIKLLTEAYLERRSDFQAAQARLVGSSIQLKAAENNKLPQLNLVLQAGYRGLDEGDGLSKYFTSYTDTTAGPNAFAKLVYRFPLANNTAQGLHAQAQAGVKQNEIIVANLKRVIQSEISTSVHSINSNSFSFLQSEQAVSFFEQALKNETTKQRMGLSSLILVQQVEDQLTNAKLSNIQAARDLASAIISLRTATETFVNNVDEQFVITKEDLTTSPREIGSDTDIK